MTQGMGIGRALELADGWSQITHVGSTSGGSWFASQLFYSEPFFSNLTDTSLPIGRFVALWGQLYQDAMVGAVASGAAWATEFDPGSFNALHPVCTAVGSLLAKTLPEICDARGFPSWAWLPYVAAMLKPWIDDIEVATFGARAMTGLATATFLEQVTLPPDAYVDGSTVATRAVTFVPPFEPNATSSSYVIPLAHATPPISTGVPAAWLRSSDISSITAKTSRGEVISTFHGRSQRGVQ